MRGLGALRYIDEALLRPRHLGETQLPANRILQLGPFGCVPFFGGPRFKNDGFPCGSPLQNQPKSGTRKKNTDPFLVKVQVLSDFASSGRAFSLRKYAPSRKFHVLQRVKDQPNSEPRANEAFLTQQVEASGLGLDDTLVATWINLLADLPRDHMVYMWALFRGFKSQTYTLERF